MKTHNSNPFMTGSWGGRPVGAVTAADRASMAKNFDLQEIDAALQLPRLQKTVVAALNRRRRQLVHKMNTHNINTEHQK